MELIIGSELDIIYIERIKEHLALDNEIEIKARGRLISKAVNCLKHLFRKNPHSYKLLDLSLQDEIFREGEREFTNTILRAKISSATDNISIAK